MTTRDEHVAWVKERALQELDGGGPMAPVNALSSLVSDLGKHPDTVGHSAIELGGMLAVAGHLSTPHEVREWIDGIR